MHPYLKQLAACIQEAKDIEIILNVRRMELPPVQASLHGGCSTFDQQCQRGHRAIYWGVRGTLAPAQAPDPVYAWFYVWFYYRNRTLVRLNYTPTQKLWNSDVTERELKDVILKASRVGDTDPDFLSREIRAGGLDDNDCPLHLTTEEAIQVVATMAQWVLEGDDPLRSKTFIGMKSPVT